MISVYGNTIPVCSNIVLVYDNMIQYGSISVHSNMIPVCGNIVSVFLWQYDICV